MGFISLNQLEKAGKSLANTDYGAYILDIVEKKLEETMFVF